MKRYFLPLLFLLLGFLLLVPQGFPGAEIDRSDINRHIGELYGRNALYRSGSGQSPQKFYKSGTLTALSAKMYPDSVTSENRLILRRPTDSNDPDFYGTGVIVYTYDSPGGKFKIHYTEDNSHGDAVAGSDGKPETIPQFVVDTATAFDNAYSRIRALGWPPLPEDGIRGGDNRFDIYLVNIPGTFGYTTFESNPSDTYIVMDNDFANAPKNLDPAGSQAGDIKVTAPDELFHAFQFQLATDILGSGWWMEASSTWMEDEIYPEVKDYLNYIGQRYTDTNDNGKWDSGEVYYNIVGAQAGTAGRTERWFDQPDTSLDTYNKSFEYGDIIWAKYLSENYGKGVIRNIWTLVSNSHTSLMATADVLSSMNLPIGSAMKDFRTKVLTLDFADRSHYPQVKHAASFNTLPQNITENLNHLSALYYTFKPDTAIRPITFNFQNMNSGTLSAVLVLRKSDGTDERNDITLDSPGATKTVTDFGPGGRYIGATLILINTSQATDIQGFSVSVSNDLPATHSASGESGGGGCFIATAAYGSRMAPEVEVLRHFRDTRLLTNPVGKEFVRLYYEWSPPVAAYLGEHEGLRAATRLALYPAVYGIKYPYALVFIISTPAFVTIGIRQRMKKRRLYDRQS